jgi:hypothetical protein
VPSQGASSSRRSRPASISSSSSLAAKRQSGHQRQGQPRGSGLPFRGEEPTQKGGVDAEGRIAPFAAHESHGDRIAQPECRLCNGDMGSWGESDSGGCANRDGYVWHGAIVTAGSAVTPLGQQVAGSKKDSGGERGTGLAPSYSTRRRFRMRTVQALIRRGRGSGRSALGAKACALQEVSEVERAGFEPAASGLQSRRSPS